MDQVFNGVGLTSQPAFTAMAAKGEGKGINRRARRSVAQAERRGLRKCDVPFCESYCQAQLSNCPHTMCEPCVFNSIGATDYDEHQPRFGLKCAICRFRYSVSPGQMKTLMAKFKTTTYSK